MFSAITSHSPELSVARTTMLRRLARVQQWLSTARRGDADPILDDAGNSMTRSEIVAQAASGLMYVHGLERGAPCRLGVDVASVAAGVLAASGVIACELARARGIPARPLSVSLPGAALIYLTTRIARETCAARSMPLRPVTSAQGIAPPLATADGHRFEFEALDAAAWQAFWRTLKVRDEAMQAAWRPFLQRYGAGGCRLPRELHDATASQSLSSIQHAALAAGVSVCRLRSNREVLASRVDDRASSPLVSAFASRPVEPDRAFRAMRTTTSDVRDDQGERAHEALPLDGVRVVEATSRTQGPLAGQLLRMLGAEILRVEPRGGDAARMESPQAGTASAYFVSVNRGKMPVELDLRRPSDRDTLRDVVATVDVFLQNWRAGRAEDWGLDATSLSRCNPQLVYCAASGWGGHVPAGDPVGVDYVVQAHAGLGDSLTPSGEPPSPSRVLLADTMGAIVACEGALTGLLQRERTGRGCSVSTSLLAGAMALQEQILDAMEIGREVRRRDGRPLWGMLDQPLPAADGWLAIDVVDHDVLRRLCAICGVDASAGSAASREQRVAERLAADSCDHWTRALSAAGIASARVRTDISSMPSDAELGRYLERVENTWAPASPWRPTDSA
jgi:crotonobetainyl-CoA:carnitine CoA-transferase CaiB-like acyl-CoA transferase